MSIDHGSPAHIQKNLNQDFIGIFRYKTHKIISEGSNWAHRKLMCIFFFFLKFLKRVLGMDYMIKSIGNKLQWAKITVHSL